MVRLGWRVYEARGVREWWHSGRCNTERDTPTECRCVTGCSVASNAHRRSTRHHSSTFARLISRPSERGASPLHPARERPLKCRGLSLALPSSQARAGPGERLRPAAGLGWAGGRREALLFIRVLAVWRQRPLDDRAEDRRGFDWCGRSVGPGDKVAAIILIRRRPSVAHSDSTVKMMPRRRVPREHHGHPTNARRPAPLRRCVSRGRRSRARVADG